MDPRPAAPQPVPSMPQPPIQPRLPRPPNTRTASATSVTSAFKVRGEERFLRLVRLLAGEGDDGGVWALWWWHLPADGAPDPAGRQLGTGAHVGGVGWVG